MSETLEERIKRVALDEWETGKITAYATDIAELLNMRDRKIEELELEIFNLSAKAELDEDITKRDNFEELPKWMQELWELSPSIARQVEKRINELKREKEIFSLRRVREE